ncbi:MAG: dockerin type I repeat-containing protein [Phycisphaeraceae bacterium]|nr:dockerin type I repeat-containing protein [Phycisphaeraceae bacterium]
MTLFKAWPLSLPRTGTVAALTLAFTASALADGVHDGDIVLLIDNSRITTFEANEEGVAPRRVFAGTLGEFGVPGVGDEPGFDNPAGTFEPGSFISFTIQSPLKVWSGEDFQPTATNPMDGVRIRLSFASLSATSADGPVDGFGLAVAPNGEWHIHYIFEVLPAPGDAEVPAGAYLLELVLHTTQEGIASSEPFWIVLNHELDEEAFEEAFEFAEETLGEACVGDLNGDGTVNGADLAVLLGLWGEEGGFTAADLNADGTVNGADIAILLGAWGDCP